MTDTHEHSDPSDPPALAAARLPWEWRKAAGGWTLDTDLDGSPSGRLTHAYDVNDRAACEPQIGLARSCEPVNEGSRLCLSCAAIVRGNPRGRPKREPADR